MARTSTQPQQTVTEDIRSLAETPPDSGTRGVVSVMVGRLDRNGDFIVPQQFEQYEIKDDAYDELCGPATAWAPDKPAGTYRNDDLWHFIDLQRAAQ